MPKLNAESEELLYSKNDDDVNSTTNLMVSPSQSVRDSGQDHSVVPHVTNISNEPVQSQLDSASDDIDVDVVHWKGWAELENDPMIFTTILRDWGVQNVEVREVIPLDTILEQDPSSVLGLIFLSRWAASEVTGETTNPPRALWFANQISTFSCATLALMNIINNQDCVTFGSELQEFKQKTLDMTPKERGLELDNFQFVKNIHNSFSRELDRMSVDLRLKDEAQASARRSRKSRKTFTKRKKRKPVEDEEENGFHFVAYVPAHGHVWRLDGMEKHPNDMGKTEHGDNWLTSVIADLQIILEASEVDGTEFSLLSLNYDTTNNSTDKDQVAVSRMREDWSPFIAHMLKLHAERGDLDALIG